MSYRSLKRVLGETNLERKCRWLFGLCLFVLIAGSFWWYGTQTEELVYKQNSNKGRLLVDTVMTLYHWQEWVRSEKHEDSLQLVQETSRSLQNQEYSWSTLKAPGMSTASTSASREPADEEERQMMRQFAANRPLEIDEETGESAVEYVERNLPERGEYHYYQAVRAKTVCLNCHRVLNNNLDMAEGDLLGVVKVTLPTHDTLADINLNRAILISTAIVTVFLAMVAAYVIVRYVIVKPLKHLRDVSDSISRGDRNVRAEIRTGDEFEELGVAFNRMLRHLMAIQAELSEVNTDLDSKVDQLAQVNMRLFEMNRLKSDFLATMSHELRTPLNSILGFSDVLVSGKELDDKQKRYVENIRKSGRMLLELINDILDLAKIESGKMDVRPSDFRIDHLIASQCDMARPLSERKNIDLVTQVQPGLPELHQDQGKVQQILNNLLTNAIKFTPEGGRIDVIAERGDGDMLELTVADTGVGISEEDQATIFEKFRQGNTVYSDGSAMTREYSGTGLGLSIVKELCRLLGGEISLESTLGKGSTFKVQIPWRAAPRAPLPTAEEPKDTGAWPVVDKSLASTATSSTATD